MGYITNYTVEVSRFADDDDVEFLENKMKKEFNLYRDELTASNTLVLSNDMKWYSFENDLKILSLQYPHLLFETTGIGEEGGDMWKNRAMNGKSETVQAHIRFAPFKEII